MTAIVMNTLTAAVTEYDWEFQSITPTHAGSEDGLFELGGDLDVEADIDGTIMTGLTLWGSSIKKRMGSIYLSIVGTGAGLLRVATATGSFSYSVAVSADGESRATPGKGICANYLAFGYSNVDGANFKLDRIEVPIAESETRRA